MINHANWAGLRAAEHEGGGLAGLQQVRAAAGRVRDLCGLRDADPVGSGLPGATAVRSVTRPARSRSRPSTSIDDAIKIIANDTTNELGAGREVETIK